MPILSAELKLYKSQVVANDPTNGGRMSAIEIVHAVKNSIFPDASEAQRTAGFSDKRKVFFKVENDADLAAGNVKNWIDDITPGGTRVVMTAATQKDTEGDLTGSERKYGAGRLNANVSAGATAIVVDAEPGAAADSIYQDSDTLIISDGTSEEFATIAVGGVAWSTDQATITLTTGLLNGYTAAANTKISSIIENATIVTVVDNFVETTAAGDYDEATYPVALDNIATVEQIWTLTFSDATNFSVSGDTLGVVGSGTVGGDFTPVNPDFTKPYFTLLAAGFSGTWANGETIVFETHPAAVPLWLLRDIPAGTSALALDDIDLAMSVEG